MPSTTGCALLRTLVDKYMSLSMYDNALFYAERLYYESSTSENLHLFALSYYRQGKVNQTYLLLNDTSHYNSSPENKYLFALACVSLDKLVDAEKALQVSVKNGMNTMTLQSLQSTPGGAAGVYLLGKICRKQHRTELAADYFKLSLQMDPYLWTSISELSEMGIVIDVQELFPVSKKSEDDAQCSLLQTGVKGSNGNRRGACGLFSPDDFNKSQSLLENNENQHFSVNHGPDHSFAMNRSVHSAHHSGGSSFQYNPNDLSQHNGMRNSNNMSYSKQLYDLNLSESLTEQPNRMHGVPATHTSMSLGMSAMAMRIPFASPTSLSSPIIESSLYRETQHSAAHSQQSEQSQQAQSSSQLMNITTEYSNHSFSRVAHNLFTADSKQSNNSNIHTAGSVTGGEVRGGNLFNNSEFGYSDAGSSMHGSSIHGSSANQSLVNSSSRHLDPRATLFGVPTPGLTPIPYHSHLMNGSHTGHSMQSTAYKMNGIRTGQLLDDSTDGGDVQQREEFRRTHLTNSSINLGGEYGSHSDCEDDEDHHPHSSHQASGIALYSNDSNISAISAPYSAIASNNINSVMGADPTGLKHNHTTGRRVSFGPTARLSFSGALMHSQHPADVSHHHTGIKGMESTLLEEDEDEDALPALSSVHSPVSSPRRRIEGESPYKLPRKTSGSFDASADGVGGATDIAVERHAQSGFPGVVSPIRSIQLQHQMQQQQIRHMNLQTQLSGLGNDNDISAILPAHHSAANQSVNILSPIYTGEADKSLLHNKTPAKAKKSMLPRRVVPSSSGTPQHSSSVVHNVTLDDIEHEMHHHNDHHNESHFAPSVHDLDASLVLSSPTTAARSGRSRDVRDVCASPPPSTMKTRNAIISPERTTARGGGDQSVTVKKAPNNKEVSASESDQQQTVKKTSVNNTRPNSKTTTSANGISNSNNSDSNSNINKATVSIPSAATTSSTVEITLEERDCAHRLLSIFTRAYQHLSVYRCNDCIETFHTLPAVHLKSGLVQQCLGRAYYELNDYKSCVLAYREMLRAEPFRLRGLEILSTALWHLKKEMELCALAQQVAEVDKFAPETWCVVGNCFSLQKEPETAIKFFSRAIQLDSSCTYAYTLTGHELVNNEDLEKAIASFRKALQVNGRHYNAWYGLGSIYYRQERYELAEYHFKKALSINPLSSVLHCYLGMALHAQNSVLKTAEALSVLNGACAVDTTNPQLHFQRAHVLVATDHLEEALEALNIVWEHAPKEPSVHAMLGQVHHRLGNIPEALRHLNTAMDLDPKEAAALKQIMIHIDDPTVVG